MSAPTYPILTTVIAVSSERGQCLSARRIGCSDLAAKKEVSKKKMKENILGVRVAEG